VEQQFRQPSAVSFNLAFQEHATPSGWDKRKTAAPAKLFIDSILAEAREKSKDDEAGHLDQHQPRRSSASVAMIVLFRFTRKNRLTSKK
jgi:hypothetical protein